MSRFRMRASLAGAAALALVVGCTGGGEDELVIDGTEDPSAVLAAAIETTLTETGRFQARQSWAFDATDDTFDDALDESGFPTATTSTGEFSGSAVSVVTSDDEGELHMEARIVGDDMYITAESFAAMFAFMSGPDDEADRSAIDEAMKGRTWVSFPAQIEETDGPGPGGNVGESPLEILSDMVESLETVSDEGTEPIDGVEHRRLRGRAPAEIWGPGPEAGDESVAGQRMHRIFELAQEYRHQEITAWISPEGLIRRVEITETTEIPEEYRECVLFMDSSESSTEVEFSDLGANISVEAPDPSDVATEDELHTFEDTFFGAGDPVDEEWTEDDRIWLEEDVRSGAWVIGLDPSTIPSMSIEELGDASDRILAAADDLPTTETALGPMNRLDLIETVRSGMEMHGIDSSGVADMDDQQLADLITAYVESEDGLGMGGVGLDMDDEMFEGCPA